MRGWIVLFPLLLTACDPSAARLETRDQSRLAAELADRQAGAPLECIDAATSQSLDIASRDTLVYRTARITYVNRLDSPCPGVRPFNHLIIEPSSSGHYCRGDRIRGVEAGSNVPGPICLLGPFIPYSRR
jgi:hypothetical protein